MAKQTTKSYHYKPYKGEIMGKTLNLTHSGLVSKEDYGSEESYRVWGRVFDVDNRSELSFEKQFETIESAEKYFEQMRKAHPLSEISVEKLTKQVLMIYL